MAGWLDKNKTNKILKIIIIYSVIIVLKLKSIIFKKIKI